jgi:hypothetical protein
MFFVCRFIKTSAVIASAPELDLPTRILYFDKMLSMLEELQTGKNTPYKHLSVFNPFADFYDCYLFVHIIFDPILHSVQ